ncbi:mevalonate kinase [Bombilactobacillus bombi]|uniref:Mevalonate kinase n=1 Tax=Bombilactobacillus bombi TaxID=1303590 RepID=A0A417Z5E5_9LACO|nr:mevalonate kinase [Bombilactobacillus bombi]RHW45979.1 mevalonate kinase [Bombilactobacillus bombi]
MIGIGQTHGKIILIGEHAVVYGQPAITIPLLDIPTIVKITPIDESISQLSSRYFEGPITNCPPELAGIRILIELLTKDLPIATTFKVAINSYLPIERGMGSSAATGAAITKAMFDYAKVPLEYSELIHYTNFSEKIIHGTPSGIDAITVNSQQPIYFIKNKITQPFSMNLAAYLVIIDSGIKGNTGAAVHDLRVFKQQQPQIVNPLLEQLGDLTQQTQQAIAQHDIKTLGQIFQTAQNILQTLNISNANLDKLVSTANLAGALGTKITGGGRGGCLIALAPTKTIAQKITQAVSSQAQKVWIQSLANLK